MIVSLEQPHTGMTAPGIPLPDIFFCTRRPVVPSSISIPSFSDVSWLVFAPPDQSSVGQRGSRRSCPWPARTCLHHSMIRWHPFESGCSDFSVVSLGLGHGAPLPLATFTVAQALSWAVPFRVNRCGIGKRAVRSADRSPHSRPRLILDRTTPALLGGRPGSSTRRAVAALLAASVAESGGASERDRRVSYSAYWRCQPLIGAGLRSMAPTRKSFAPTEATDAVAIS
jgi:hypothetical protein